MTVDELIELLRRHPGDATVVVQVDEVVGTPTVSGNEGPRGHNVTIDADD